MSMADTIAAQDERPSGKAEAVLAAAEQTFLARGFGAVSMDAIAREAAVSKATVYAHFASKEELFGAVIARVSERRFGAFSADALDPHAVEASLTTIAQRFLELVLSAEGVAVNRIVIAEVTRFPVLGDVFWQSGPERTRMRVEGFLRRAVEAGTLAVPDARRAAEHFLALARGEIHLRELLRPEGVVDKAAIGAAANDAVAIFLRAFGTDRAPSRRG
jgi:TetR/AcrR family transcriptional repressor of mexJK operon